MAVGVGTSLFADLGNLGTRRSSRFYCTSRCLLQESTLQSGLHVPSDQERLLELQNTPPNPDECEQAMLKHGIRAVPATSLFTLKYYLHTNYGKTGFSSAPKKWNPFALKLRILGPPGPPEDEPAGSGGKRGAKSVAAPDLRDHGGGLGLLGFLGVLGLCRASGLEGLGFS